MSIWITRTIDCPICGKEVYRIDGKLFNILAVKDVNVGTYRQAHNTPCCGMTEADYNVVVYEVPDGLMVVQEEVGI